MRQLLILIVKYTLKCPYYDQKYPYNIEIAYWSKKYKKYMDYKIKSLYLTIFKKCRNKYPTYPNFKVYVLRYKSGKASVNIGNGNCFMYSAFYETVTY